MFTEPLVILFVFIEFVFIVCPSRRLPEYIETKVMDDHLFVLHLKLFKKAKEIWN